MNQPVSRDVDFTNRIIFHITTTGKPVVIVVPFQRYARTITRPISSWPLLIVYGQFGPAVCCYHSPNQRWRVVTEICTLTSCPHVSGIIGCNNQINRSIITHYSLVWQNTKFTVFIWQKQRYYAICRLYHLLLIILHQHTDAIYCYSNSVRMYIYILSVYLSVCLSVCPSVTFRY